MAATLFAAALFAVLGLISPSFAPTSGALGGYGTYPSVSSTYQSTHYPGYYGMGNNLGGLGGYGVQYPVRQTVSSVSQPVGYGGWGFNGLGYGTTYPVRSSVSTAVTSHRPATYGGWGLNGWGGSGYGFGGLGYAWGGLRYGAPYPVGPVYNRGAGLGGFYGGYGIGGPFAGYAGNSGGYY